MTGSRLLSALIVCAAPAALLLSSVPAEARHGFRDVEVGPIWNDMDAQRKCPKAARDLGGTWTGQWHTTRPGQMSVCEIAGAKSGRGNKDRWLEAGPIWNQFDAERKCPDVARRAGAKWTGQWKTTRPGQMSVCEVK